MILLLSTAKNLDPRATILLETARSSWEPASTEKSDRVSARVNISVLKHVNLARNKDKDGDGAGELTGPEIAENLTVRVGLKAR